MTDAVSGRQSAMPSASSAHLQSLGFRAEELFQCELSDGLIIVPAALDGDSTRFLLDTGATTWITLSHDYAATRFVFENGEEVPSTSDVLGYVTVKHLVVLGKSFSERTLSVRRRDTWNRVAGLVGIRFFDGGFLAIDPRSGLVGASARPELRSCLPRAICRLRLLEAHGEYVAITSDLREGDMRGEHPVLLLDSGSTGSLLTLDYALRKPWYRPFRWLAVLTSRRARRRLLWVLELPGGTGIWTRVGVVPSLQPFARAAGLERVDGVLGMNFLRRWVLVFDFYGGELGLFRHIRT